MQKLVATVAFLLLFFRTVNAQNNYISQQLDNSSGLSNSCVNSILKDADNLTWFGTWDGLNVFNGTAIHVFNYGKNDLTNSIANNIIYQLAEDKKSNIWIGTVEGVSCYNKSTGSFKNFFYKKRKTTSGYAVAVDNKGVTYAAQLNSNTISYYDVAVDSFKNCRIEGLSKLSLNKMAFDNSGGLWLLGNDGKLQNFIESASGFKLNSSFSCAVKTDNFFIVNNTVFFITGAGKVFKVDKQFKTKNVATVAHQVRSMAWYQGHYFFAWSSKGFGEYNENFAPAPDVAHDIQMLKNVRITSLTPGSDNTLWFGTDGNGVIKVLRNANTFGTVTQQLNGQQFNIPVRAFCEVNNQLWVGTKGNGIITIKNIAGPDASYSKIESFRANSDLLDNCVYAIKKGIDGYVYIGSDAVGLTLYDIKQKRFIEWKNIKGSDTMTDFRSVHCILQDADSSVWLGLNTKGLIHLKLKTDNSGQIRIQYLENFPYSGNNKGPANDVIYTLAAGSNNNLWVGCRYGGLSLFNKYTKRFKTFKAFSYNGSLSNNDVLSLFIDHRRRLWIGTSYGLNWINENDCANVKEPIFKKLSMEQGLPNNTIHAIEEDNKGNIWISTNKGLAKVEPVSQSIIQFTITDGLQSDEFSDNAVWKNKAGYLFFGGIYGFNYFLSENIRVNKTQPKLLLSDLQIAGKQRSGFVFKALDEHQKPLATHFELGPNANYFDLRVEPVTYLNPQKCQYVYLLYGYDKTWHNLGHGNSISYNGLQPGNYTLVLKWSNGEGVWTKPVVALTLTVNQYFWLTTTALLFYAAFLGILVYAFYRYRKNKFLIRHELKLEHLLREKDEKQHQEQLSFFTNIAHELQTPLTLIVGSLERQAGPVQHRKDYLSIVKQQASRLHYLVHQLLEFRKAETVRQTNNFTLVNVSGLLQNIVALFEPLTIQKDLDLSCTIESEMQLWIDRDKTEKIVFNLLSNACKHTPQQHLIIFSAEINAADSQLEIVVTNSGCQLSEEEIARLFDKFFIAGTGQKNKYSTGIGLAYTKQMVSGLGGSIDVDCKNGWVTFKAVLPLSSLETRDFALVKNEEPSYLLQATIADETAGKQLSIAENNKRALINSIAQPNQKSILVVEDEDVLRYLINDILSDTYIVYEASTGKEAVETMRNVIPDIILSDIMMPDMDGLELCSLLKNTPETCHIPFVMLSARGTELQKAEGYESGADAYIPKPFQTEYLLIRIKKLLEQRDKLHGFFKNDQWPAAIKDKLVADEDRCFLQNTLKLIEEHLTEEYLDADFLEKKLNVSRIQLYRKLKSISNMTPGELIRNVRLQNTARLLTLTDLTVSEIYFRSGFNNQSYFYREFRKHFNCSPNAYRSQYRLPVV